MVAVIKIDMMLTLLTDCCKESSHKKIRVSSRLTWPAAVAPGQHKLIVTLSLLSSLSQALLWRKCGQWAQTCQLSRPESQQINSHTNFRCVEKHKHQQQPTAPSPPFTIFITLTHICNQNLRFVPLQFKINKKMLPFLSKIILCYPRAFLEVESKPAR